MSLEKALESVAKSLNIGEQIIGLLRSIILGKKEWGKFRKENTLQDCMRQLNHRLAKRYWNIHLLERYLQGQETIDELRHHFSAHIKYLKEFEQVYPEKISSYAPRLAADLRKITLLSCELYDPIMSMIEDEHSKYYVRSIVGTMYSVAAWLEASVHEIELTLRDDVDE